MENSDQKNSVPTEQFDKNAENANYEDIKNVTTVPVDETANADIELVDKPLKKQKAKPKVEGEAKIIDEAKDEAKSKSKSKGESKSKSKVLELDNEEDVTKGVSNKELILTNETQPVKNSDEKVIIKSPGKSDNENIPELSKEEEKIDYTKLSREDIVKVFKDILDKPVSEIREEVDIIKINFYKKHKQYTDKLRANFLKEGGLPEDFKPQEDIVEDEFKELLNKFKSLKSDLNKQLEVEKEANLDEKYKIIEEIKDLINRKESINRTFNEFRELQRRWREIGLVPQQKVKDLWDTYHHHVEKFYDYIKINKELRDIDLKKNLELKIILCEKAEDLLLEPSVIKAFDELQKLHERWREIGPVSKEFKDSAWDRFKAATTTINKKYQEHFEQLKSIQKKNLEAKTLLCEQAEDILNTAITNHNQWEHLSNKVKELQKIWKTIGFAPKKHNVKIYQRFRDACDQFFAKKREFYAENKEIQTNNLQLKIDLCEQAELLKDSTDWKKATEDLIFIQKRWKEIGPLPKKQSDEVWKRFRLACDHFFNRKKEFFSNVDSKYDDNLKLKEQIIKEINDFKPADDVKENIKVLKDFQRRWAEIGYVPIKDKVRIQNLYRDAINKHFDNLELNESKKDVLKFKNKLESIKQSPKYQQRLRVEREKYYTRLKKLENNIVLWENNIGFFAKSKNADSMIEDVNQKIVQAKEEIKALEEKITIIDNLE